GVEIKVSERSLADSEAFAAAEAGIEYARWQLAHASYVVTEKTEATYPYRDAGGNAVGTFTITITPPSGCDSAITIRARGASAKDPRRTRAIAVRYGATPLTRYAFLTNANIWFGGADELKGPVHANGGIRMDAKSSARMTSAKATYICGTEHGCSPPVTKPGVWGSGDGGKKGLWDFPLPAIGFQKIATDLRALQMQAQNANTYFGPSGAFGYHITLQTNGTAIITRVTAVQQKIWGYDGRNGWVETAEGIAQEMAVRSMTIPEATGCGVANLLFFEDTVWVDGATKHPVTIVAGRLPISDATDASIFINGNLTTPASGDAGKEGTIGLIAQKDILIPLAAPDTLELHAALIAQNGHVFRNYYCSDEKLNKYGYKCNRAYAPLVLRNALHLKGTIVTNQTTAWSWVDAKGSVISGYRGGESTYETRLIITPPPFFPTEGAYRILSWEEVRE
ncbi:MAG: hypothetical protein UY81_C0030G0008, partial [Candidatus Giovannonibacteria bacterium GW2011_GWA2_53_7]